MNFWYGKCCVLELLRHNTAIEFYLKLNKFCSMSSIVRPIQIWGKRSRWEIKKVNMFPIRFYCQTSTEWLFYVGQHQSPTGQFYARFRKWWMCVTFREVTMSCTMLHFISTLILILLSLQIKIASTSKAKIPESASAYIDRFISIKFQLGNL
jgi:hypothetical protein